MDWPVPTRRALIVAGLGLLPAALSVLAPALVWVTLALDTALVLLCAADYLFAPRATALRATRRVQPVLSSGAPNAVTLELEAAAGTAGRLRGEVRDVVPPGPEAEGHARTIDFEGRATLRYRLTPRTRGDLTLGPLWVRLQGPLGLCARQFPLPLVESVKVYPDLAALTQAALALARTNTNESRRVLRVRGEGREFESLREYRQGDDRRSIDWKATARRSRPMVRLHQPERNQTVLLLIDCGRHMTGEVDGRRKLDHAVDAALKVARVSLDAGDQVGVLAFGAEVKSWLPPRKGREQLAAIARALYRVEATLEDSDYGAAIDRAFSRGTRRSLVVVLTDLLDATATEQLHQRLRRLAPRHLPLVASLLDQGVHSLATRIPADAAAAWQRLAAARLEGDALATVARLRDAGVRVVRQRPADFGAAAVNAYLDVKARGLL